jgi:hypothetical protein
MLRDHTTNEDPALRHTMLQEPGDKTPAHFVGLLNITMLQELGDETPAHFVGLLNIPRINKHPTNDSSNAMHHAL